MLRFRFLYRQFRFFLLFRFVFQLKESFKDLKKKFNNLKFNYMKKNEKLRNLKAVRNQLQQIEIYVEKLQVNNVHTFCVIRLLI